MTMIADYLWLWLGTLALSVAIGLVIIICMAAAAKPQKVVSSRRIIAAAVLVPTIILLLGLGFANPMPQTVAAHLLAASDQSKPFGNAAATTACIVLLVCQIPTLVYTGIAYARRAGGPGPMATAGVVSGCVFLGVITLLAVLAAGQLLAGVSL